MCAVVLRAEISNIARIQLYILRWLNIRERCGFVFEEKYLSGTCRAHIAVGDWDFPFEWLGALLMHRETFLVRHNTGFRGRHQNKRQTGLFSPAGGDRRNWFSGWIGQSVPEV